MGKKSENNTEKVFTKESRLTKFSNLTVKDVIYGGIIVMLLLTIILLLNFLLFFKATDSKVIIDQVSFTASITSIFLAFVAIVYAFFQSRESSAQNKQVHDGLSYINERIAQFSSIKDDFTLMRKDLDIQSKNLNGAVDSVKIVIDELQGVYEDQKENGKVPEELSEKMEQITKKIEGIEKSNNSSYTFSNKYNELFNPRLETTSYQNFLEENRNDSGNWNIDPSLLRAISEKKNE